MIFISETIIKKRVLKYMGRIIKKRFEGTFSK